MSESHYYQYAFARSDCRAPEIGPGVDSRFQVEWISDGPVAAVASRIGLDQFTPERLHGKTAEDIRWLGEIATRHNEIVCELTRFSPVLPLQLGTVFHSRESLQATLARCQPTVAEFLHRLGDRQEWGVKLYLENPRFVVMQGHASPPSPHCLATTRPTDYAAQMKEQQESRRGLQVAVHQTIQAVEQRLTGKAENCCRIRTPSDDLTGRGEEMVFNAAFLLPSSAQESWLETVQHVRREVEEKGLLLEASGPWPPYHFCPSLPL
jgi:hypothetical protein